MLAIKNNIMASNAARHLGMSYDALATSVERLSSGLRINSAKDDAAGLAVRELMRAEVAVLQQGGRNALDGISMLQTMEGAMGVINEILVRMKELAEQAATGSYSETQRTIMNDEFAEMANEVERIAGATKFNDINMLNSNTGTVSVHVGTTSTIDIDKVDMTQSGLNIEVGDGEWSTMSNFTTAYADIDSAVALHVEGGADLSININFTDSVNGVDQQEINVKFAADDYTLQDVVEAINAESQNPPIMYDAEGNKLGYAAASIFTNDDGTYQLEIAGRNTVADGMTIDIDAADPAASDGMTGIFGVVEAQGTDLMGDLGAGIDLFQAQDDEGVWQDDNTGGVGAGLNILDVDAAELALDIITTAINTKDTARASFGYKMNRLESTISILNIQSENLMTAESRISDVDVATEMAAMTRNQVLAQAGISMLAQANAMPQMALTLLR